MTRKTNEGLADMAHMAERDHEVQMARADLYKIAKYAIKLHDMLKSVSEEEGLEGWQQSKITKAADYISSVYHNLDYDMKFGDQVTEAKQCSCCGDTPCSCDDDCPDCGGKGVYEGKSPHKKGSKKYKKHMAAMHANESEYKNTLYTRLQEKAKSKAQQKFMGMVYATKKGEKPASKEVAKAAKGMSKADAKDFASTKHKGKPEHVKKK